MTDRMTSAERAAVAGRTARRPDKQPAATPIDYHALPAAETLHERIAAAEIAEAIAAGNRGAVRKLLAELENGASRLHVQPWVLLHELAELATREQRRAPAPAAAVPLKTT